MGFARREQVRRWWPLAVCVLLLVGCAALIRPFLESGLSDDFSYIWSTRVYAETGHIQYVGWSSTMLGWLLPFGALFLKVFGFSFTAARGAVFAIAVLNTVLLYDLLLDTGATPRNAALATCAVALSPACLPYAFQYFSDGPGMFTGLVTIWLCLRMLRARTPQATVWWMAAAFAANVGLGTVRQVLWLGALVMVPCAAWLVRKRKGMLPAAAALWVVSVAAIAYAVHWFSSQPYALIEPLLLHFPRSQIVKILLMPPVELLVALAPLLLGFLWAVRERGSRRLAVCSAAAVLAGVGLVWANGFQAAQAANYDLLPVLPRWAVVAFLALALGCVPLVLKLLWHAARRDKRLENPAAVTVWELCVLLLPFLAGVMFMASTRQAFFGRYLMPVLAVLALLLTRLQTEEGKGKGFAWPMAVVVAAYAALTVIGQHDLYRRMNALLELERQYKASGMPRNQLEAGYALDGWYQLEQRGYINEQKIHRPAGAYVEHLLSPALAPCHEFFIENVPAIAPRYGVTDGNSPCFMKQQLFKTQVRTWTEPRNVVWYIAPYAPGYALDEHLRPVK